MNLGTSAADLKKEGLALLVKGKNEEALAIFNKAVGIEIQQHGERDPTVACSKITIGGILQSQGKHDEALKKYDEALDVLQHNTAHKSAIGVIALNKGSCYLSLGDVEKALASGKQAIALKEEVYGVNHVEVSSFLQ
jgi:tetratricopeptide (TPR) repeat protein